MILGTINHMPHTALSNPHGVPRGGFVIISESLFHNCVLEYRDLGKLVILRGQKSADDIVFA